MCIRKQAGFDVLIHLDIEPYDADAGLPMNKDFINKQMLLTIACGILSAGTFAVATYGAGSGLLIMFLPVVPLALIGLSHSAKHTLLAAVAACITIGIIDAGSVPLFILLSAFPAYHFVRRALLWRGDEQERRWYPVVSILAELTAISACIFMLLAFSASMSEHTDLSSLIAVSMKEQINSTDPNIAEMMKTLVTQWSFLIFAGISWLWVTMLYVFIALANRMLNQYNLALRPDLSVSEEGLPLWLPFIMLACAGLAVIGHGNDRFTGETVFLIFLLPYFMTGIASFHRISQRWKNRWFWLTCFYFGMTLFFPWIALLLIARGAQLQLEAVIKEKHG